MLRVEQVVPKSQYFLGSTLGRWDGGIGLGIWLEKKAELDNGGHTMIRDTADWGALLDRLLLAIGHQGGMADIRLL